MSLCPLCLAFIRPSGVVAECILRLLLFEKIALIYSYYTLKSQEERRNIAGLWEDGFVVLVQRQRCSYHFFPLCEQRLEIRKLLSYEEQQAETANKL